MTTTFITTDIATGFTVQADGDILDVMPSGTVTSTSSAITGSVGCEIDVLGSVAGAYYGIVVGASGESSVIDVGSSGVVSSGEADYGAIREDDAFRLNNYGEIFASGAFSDGLSSFFAGAVINYGSINALGDGLASYDGSSTDHWTVVNYGSISGDDSFLGSREIDAITNAGVMNGAVQLGAGAGSYLSSTNGSVSGTITCGAGGDVVIAGDTGGVVMGGAGNDVLYANPTQTAADNAAQTTLDGAKGNNWLYGDGAYTTFDSGDNAAGTYNQIFGGASEMMGVLGYTNNTVSYASLSSSYKSVYVNLLQSDAYMCTISKANGAPASDFVFEDYLRNVPNVIGSSGSDVIVCDNGVDRITSGANKGGDVFYAGAGAASQDTFAFTALTESSLSNYDIIENFKIGVDKFDFTALDLPISDFFLSYGGSSSGGANTIYVEKNPSTGFNSATDMIISVKASTSTAMTYGDLIL